LAVKGLGGYHLACDARNEEAVRALRRRKYRKEKPFALMVPDLRTAHSLVALTEAEEAMLDAPARPIVLAPARRALPGVAPGNRDLGVMLPYTPLHHLLFDGGAPGVLVMTSANRSSEPIAYRDDDAFERLDGLADAFLVGERPIARRVDDSVARSSPFGPVVLRRARGYAPGVVVSLPTTRPILALGADLKNTVTLVVDGQAFVSQHIGDLAQYGVFQAFQETIRDLMEMYAVAAEDLLVVHDSHPQYASTAHAAALPGTRLAVQHHRAHIASVLAERGAWDRPVVGFAFDGTGYGDDGGIWGGEVFVGRCCSAHRIRTSKRVR
jgi:hydrogenase maturation protein HypF